MDAVLQFINTEGGRVVMTGPGPEYQYHLKDHLGNVRLTFTTGQRTDEATATLEAASLATEQGEFLRYEHARRVQASLFDRTNGSSPGYSQRLNGSADEIYGLARSLSVMPGDTVSAEVYVKYVDPETGNWNQALTNLMTAIANNTGGIVVDGAGYSGSTASFPHGGLLNTSGSGDAPKAFLNWLVFDRDFNMLDGGFVPVTTAARETGTDIPHERLARDNIVITKPGYVYIYLSNENGELVEVFFDDCRVEHVKSPVVQVDDYYPFGLTFNSYSRENATENRYLYNQGTGEKTFKTERIAELDLDVDMSKERTYDYITGRWWQVDPKADSLSNFAPYNYAFNNPIRYNDPKGDCPPEDNNPCGGTTSVLKAALQPNVSSNVKAATNSASDVMSITVGIQAAGIGGKIQLGKAIGFEAMGKVGAGEITMSSNGPEANVSAVTTDLGAQVTPWAAASFSQNDMTYNGDSFQMSEYDGGAQAGPFQYGTTSNEISVGAVFGNLSAEISANLDALGDAINSGVEATKQFFTNLLPTSIWEY